MSSRPVATVRTLEDIARIEAHPLDAWLPGRSVHDLLARSAARAPDRVALTMLMTGAPDEQPRRVTYAELLRLVNRTANLFTALGGERPGVAYMLPSLVETYATLIGAESAGFAVPINYLLQPQHIADLVRSSGAGLLVALGPHPQLDIWPKALKVRELLPHLTLLCVSLDGTTTHAEAVDLHSALTAHAWDKLDRGAPRRDADVAAYFHTGGTTGAPKLVAHTHRGQLAAAFGGAALAGMTQDDILTASLPLFHVGGTIFSALSPLMAGAELVVMSPVGMRNPAMVRNCWAIVERYGVTLLGAVPTSIAAMVEVPPADADIRTLRAGFCGAASLPLAVGERFKQVTGRTLYEIYGATEASGIIAIDPTASTGVAGSVGLPLPFTRVEVRRINPDGNLGAVCTEAGEVGNLVVHGPTVSPGYLDPQHNDAVFIDGALNTGDLGYRDATGRIHIAGRSKDLIIRSGHNIDPLMIENAMQHHPAVALAAAVGMPDSYAGELPVCYVQLQPGATATADELREHAERVIAERPAWPKHIRIVDAIPLTSVGKIYKPQLRCAEATRLATRLVHEDLGVAGAEVHSREGGRRGMTVGVVLPREAVGRASQVRDALKDYLFEVDVTVREQGD